MGYLRLADRANGSAVAAEAAAPLAEFSALEWLVIGLAQRDRVSSLHAPGLLRRVAGLLIGAPRNLKLADPRLEALRRFAVLAWRRGERLPEREVAAFAAAGFGAEHQALVHAAVALRRAGQAR